MFQAAAILTLFLWNMALFGIVFMVRLCRESEFTGNPKRFATLLLLLALNFARRPRIAHVPLLPRAQSFPDSQQAAEPLNKTVN